LPEAAGTHLLVEAKMRTLIFQRYIEKCSLKKKRALRRSPKAMILPDP
jgi:hypothetical protein